MTRRKGGPRAPWRSRPQPDRVLPAGAGRADGQRRHGRRLRPCRARRRRPRPPHRIHAPMSTAVRARTGAPIIGIVKQDRSDTARAHHADRRAGGRRWLRPAPTSSPSTPPAGRARRPSPTWSRRSARAGGWQWPIAPTSRMPAPGARRGRRHRRHDALGLHRRAGAGRAGLRPHRRDARRSRPMSSPRAACTRPSRRAEAVRAGAWCVAVGSALTRTGACHRLVPRRGRQCAVPASRSGACHRHRRHQDLGGAGDRRGGRRRGHRADHPRRRPRGVDRRGWRERLGGRLGEDRAVAAAVTGLCHRRPLVGAQSARSCPSRTIIRWPTALSAAFRRCRRSSPTTRRPRPGASIASAPARAPTSSSSPSRPGSAAASCSAAGPASGLPAISASFSTPSVDGAAPLEDEAAGPVDRGAGGGASRPSARRAGRVRRGRPLRGLGRGDRRGLGAQGRAALPGPPIRLRPRPHRHRRRHRAGDKAISSACARALPALKAGSGR